jgi:membrane fusion protein, multidrug efflux system
MGKKLPLMVLLGVGLALLILIELRPWRDPQSESVPAPAQIEQGQKDQQPVAQGGTPAQPGDPARPSPAQSPDSLGSKADVSAIRAQLSPVTFTTITGELNARIQSIPKREGEYFDQGEPLIVYDCSTQRAQLEKNQALMAIAQRNFETNAQLLKLESVSQVEYENSRSEFERARAEVNELTAVISRCVTPAPFPGSVVEQKVRSQQFVQPGQPLLDIIDARALELEFIAPSRWAPWLRIGYQFRVRVDETSREYPARVTRVAARIDSVSQTFKVVAQISGSYRELKPGMSGTLLIEPPASAKP